MSENQLFSQFVGFLAGSPRFDRRYHSLSLFLSRPYAQLTAGTGRVYDKHFQLVADLAMAEDGESSFVNDVIVTKTAAYFTDSFQAQLYKASCKTTFACT